MVARHRGARHSHNTEVAEATPRPDKGIMPQIRATLGNMCDLRGWGQTGSSCVNKRYQVAEWASLTLL